MRRNLFTDEEITLCAYIAINGRSEFGKEKIVGLTNRSLPSICMKVQNIAAMLCEEGYGCHASISLLTGLPKGLRGRRTNWDVVKNLPITNKSAHFIICKKIFEEHNIKMI